MKSWLQGRKSDARRPATAERSEPDEEGRKDEHHTVDRAHSAHHQRIDNADVTEAYERGRRDERARHRGSPLTTFLILTAALAGVGVLFLAAREGSVGGGQTVDDNIRAAAHKVQTPVRHAADTAGQALEDAGQSLKQNAGKR